MWIRFPPATLQDKQMKTLEFRNPVFRRGMLVTVRRGYKRWADLEIGEKVKLCGDKIVPRTATIMGLACCRFYDIPQHVLDLEHDPVCTDRYVLLNEMKRCYKSFVPWEIVTIIFFVVEG